IVTLHLIFGLTTVGLLWWLWLSLQAEATDMARVRFGAARGAVWAARLAVLALVVLAVQIALGGWTSSNYAAIACPDFPTCQGSWWPAMDYRHAFVLWHAPGIDYEGRVAMERRAGGQESAPVRLRSTDSGAGGILTSAARRAIHFTHRMGAAITACVLIAAAIAALRQRARARPRMVAWFVLAAL